MDVFIDRVVHYTGLMPVEQLGDGEEWKDKTNGTNTTNRILFAALSAYATHVLAHAAVLEVVLL